MRQPQLHQRLRLGRGVYLGGEGLVRIGNRDELHEAYGALTLRLLLDEEQRSAGPDAAPRGWSLAAPVKWLSTSTPRSSSRAAMNSLATRFMPSCKLLT